MDESSLSCEMPTHHIVTSQHTVRSPYIVRSPHSHISTHSQVPSHSCPHTEGSRQRSLLVPIQGLCCVQSPRAVAMPTRVWPIWHEVLARLLTSSSQIPPVCPAYTHLRAVRLTHSPVWTDLNRSQYPSSSVCFLYIFSVLPFFENQPTQSLNQDNANRFVEFVSRLLTLL